MNTLIIIFYLFMMKVKQECWRGWALSAGFVIQSWWAGLFQRCRFYLLAYEVLFYQLFDCFEIQRCIFLFHYWFQIFFLFLCHLTPLFSSFLVASFQDADFICWLYKFCFSRSLTAERSRDPVFFFFTGFKFSFFFCVTWPLCFQVFSWLVPKMQILSASFRSIF